MHVHPHNAHSACTALFRNDICCFFPFHGKSTVLAPSFNTPDSHFQGRRTILERSSTAIGRDLGAIGDHPAISAVGWDVLLSGLSLGRWAANRGLDVQAILSSCALSFGGKSNPAIDAMSDSKSIVGEVEETIETSVERSVVDFIKKHEVCFR